jgi:hypothetical protein
MKLKYLVTTHLYQTVFASRLLSAFSAKYLRLTGMGLLWLLLSVSGVEAQKAKTPEEMVETDFPKLWAKFEQETRQQKARFVIAVDISNSMQPYAQSLRTNLNDFVAALPNGDYLTFIQKADCPDCPGPKTGKAEQTQIKIPNQLIDDSKRGLILSYMNNLKFNSTGSDGFTMADLIAKSLNQAGSSRDMKYVFIFTDFEYWTSKNFFNKNAEKWKNIKIRKDSGFLKLYGLELTQKGRININTNAVYKNELTQIFGPIEFLDGNFLKDWFNNTKGNILEERLKYVLETKTNKEKSSMVLKASGLGKDLKISLKEANMSSLFTEAELDAGSLVEVQKTSETRPWIGSFKPEPVIITVKAKLRAPNYGSEVDKLLDPQFAYYKIEVYQGKPYLPWYIGWPLVGLLVFWVLSVLYTIFLKKVTRTWIVGSNAKDRSGASGGTIPNKQFYNPSYFTIGSSSSNASANHFNIDKVTFCFKVESRKNILCLPFSSLKSGYYITKTTGGSAEIIIDRNKKLPLVSNNKSIFLSKAGSFNPVSIIINESNLTYTINIK